MCPGDAIYAQIMLGAMLDTGVVRRNSEPNKLDEIPQRVVPQRCCQCGCTCRGRDVEQDRLLGDDADDDSLDVYQKSHVTFSGPWWEQVRSMQCDELDSTTPPLRENASPYRHFWCTGAERGRRSWALACGSPSLAVSFLLRPAEVSLCSATLHNSAPSRS